MQQAMLELARLPAGMPGSMPAGSDELLAWGLIVIALAGAGLVWWFLRRSGEL